MTYRYPFQRYLARHATRRRRRLGWAAIGATALIFAGCVAVRADSLSPTAERASGTCDGIRADPRIDQTRPVIVTVERPDGSTAFFRCDPADGAGIWHKPVERTVEWR
jgi:hypothetical protein